MEGRGAQPIENYHGQPIRNANRPRRQAAGFTLIELMVVVAVVAILGTIAVSTYRSYILRTNRTEARMALLATQVAQEKYFLQNNQYAPDIATVIAAPPAGLGHNLTAGGVTTGGNYTISFRAVTANTLHPAGGGHRNADQGHARPA